MINEIVLIVALLAHYIGDFLLQTYKIASAKEKGLRGVAVHCAIITLVNLMLLSLWGVRGIVLGLFISAAHFAIDATKNKVKDALNLKPLSTYLLDQIEHITVIFLSVQIMSPWHSEWLGMWDLFGLELVVLPFLMFGIIFGHNTLLLKLMMSRFLGEQLFFKLSERIQDGVCGTLGFLTFFYGIADIGKLLVFLTATIAVTWLINSRKAVASTLFRIGFFLVFGVVLTTLFW